jgi:hypothetical protein
MQRRHLVRFVVTSLRQQVRQGAAMPVDVYVRVGNFVGTPKVFETKDRSVVDRGDNFEGGKINGEPLVLAVHAAQVQNPQPRKLRATHLQWDTAAFSLPLRLNAESGLNLGDLDR